MNGCIGKINTKGASGWVQVPRDSLMPGEAPVVRVLVRGKLFLEGAATAPRADISTESTAGFAFSLHWKGDAIEAFSSSDVTASVIINAATAPLALYKPVKIALDLATLSPSASQVFFENLDEGGRRRLTKLLALGEKAAATGQNQRGLACVITYAQDADAWFPYFYRYYSRIVGPSALYVITPKPALFAGYELGGLISAANLQYDDIARAYLTSSLATGLHAYYEWSLVCDVDEFLAPYPGSGQNFQQALAASKEDVLLVRGFDILQTSQNPDFDTSRPILEQRRFAVPNTALCKPHLSRVPIRYSGGHHYCQMRLNFSPPRSGFITLHLKWACRTMRAAVTRVVQGTTYSSEETATYSLRSTAPETQHPMATDAHVLRAQSLSSDAMAEFEQTYRNNLSYSAARDLWVGKHFTAPFVVDFGA